MNILEKEIEDIVFSTSNGLLRERGLFLRGMKFRQVNLGSYGIADIICVDMQKYDISQWGIAITIIELKKNLIDVNTLMQSARYEKGIQRLLKRSHNLSSCSVTYHHILIGKEIQENGDFVFLADAMYNANIYTYSIDIEKGILFKPNSGYTATNEMVGCLTKAQKAGLSEMIKVRATEYSESLLENQKDAN